YTADCAVTFAGVAMYAPTVITAPSVM
ncbi:MAG: hypothetical protein RL417_599, partial [Pseudomonadota bacterium]